MLGGYEQVDGITSAGLDGAGGFGVRGAKKVQAVYGSGTEAKPLGAGLIQFTGAYGTIGDPEKTVDAMFADLAAKARKGPGKGGERSTMLGRPQDFGSDGAVLKCQEARVEGSSAPAGRKEARTALCAWADGSTAAIVLSMDTREAEAGRAASLEEAAATTRKLRQEVRVKR
ncbi:hypothetical protein ABT390_01470 [Streptomyces aurantiacus]|uniref:Uncharacterized protein n=1 Tax=Streptomyces aurantiacus JA 4570 TaxID=1286094 RepID=S3ZEY9_9ACTN|nr:hypothetical protein [Streptomyces aurantiacus]EPH41703.1 hypothetical protein STRAU_5240 [Streptomyces aurantiacus JA 4570]